MNEDMMTEAERASKLAEPAANDTPTRGKGVFYVHTLGCQMNVHDSERIAGVLEADGYVPATEEQYLNHDIDLIVMNTCAVRENAAERMYGTIGLWAELKRERPNLQIAVGGCMAQLDREKIAKKAPWVDACSVPRTSDPCLSCSTRPASRPCAGEGAGGTQLLPKPAANRPCVEGVELGGHLRRLQQHLHLLHRADHARQGT